MTPISTAWETRFQTWKKKASDSEDAKYTSTEKQIRAAVTRGFPQGSPIRVYAKGSYPNHTNVRLDSDVDVAVEYHGFHNYDLIGNLSGLTGPQVGLPIATTGPYLTDKGAFRNDVQRALKRGILFAQVQPGNKSLKLRQTISSLAADIVPAFEYRLYYGQDRFGRLLYHRGQAVYPVSGPRIINWPDQHKANGIAKNDRTGRRYKRIVRILKRLENEMVEKKIISEVPSYFIESLVYNVNDQFFQHETYEGDVYWVLLTILTEAGPGGSAAATWTEVNGLKPLFSPEQAWTIADAHRFARVAWAYLGWSK